MAPRVRQVVVVAADLAAASARLEAALGVERPFHDPGVAEFGLRNAVYELGDTFVEVVSPERDDTAAGRHLARRGGDAGYMVIVQVDDSERTRAQASSMGLRVVWQADLPDIAGTHLHPKDVPGAIVSFDTPVPPASWRWGGPRWTGTAPDDASGAAVVGVTIAVPDVDIAVATWASLFGARNDVEPSTLSFADGAQRVHFVPGEEGLLEVVVGGRGSLDAEVCGVRFRSSD
jgi:hypothetical protein